jgi:hypothetical protein
LRARRYELRHCLGLSTKSLSHVAIDERGFMVTYLAKLAGVSTKIVWNDIKLLQSMTDEERPLVAKP